MKKVLITGASGDIGSAIAREFAKDSELFLYLHYHSSKERADELVSEIGEDSCEAICFDLQDRDSVKKALEGLEIDILINNAALLNDKLFFWMSDDEWESVIDANLNGAYRVIKALLPQMISKKYGSIINISSITSSKGNIAQCNYGASKAGLEALTRSLAKEVGRYNIRVNTVTPGIIKSKLTESMNEKEYKKIISLARFGEAGEVAEVVYFVAIKASYINAQNIQVCGGFN